MDDGSQKTEEPKITGRGGIIPEILKAVVYMPVVRDKLYQLSVTVWKGEEVPKHWMRGLLVSIWKQGRFPREDLSNHRGITLLAWTKKVIDLCINDRLHEVCKQVLEQENAGFRAARSGDDITFAARRMIEDFVRMPANTESPLYDEEDDNDLYMLYVDFEKAYDTVVRRLLYYILRHKYGIPDNVVDMIIGLHEGLEITPQVRNYVWKRFEVRVGLQQGCVLSPNLWNLFLNHIMQEWKVELGEGDWGVPIHHCRD